MNATVETFGKSPRCIGTHTVVLFDPRDGYVHHVHHAFIFDGGGARPTPEALEAIARRNAAHRPRAAPPATLDVLHLRDLPLVTGPHRVDLASRQLVSRDAG